MPYVPTAASRTYSAPPSQHNLSMAMLFDPDWVTAGLTGNWRPQTPADFANINITGATLSIGAVAVTGSPNVRVINPQAITGSVTPAAYTFDSTVTTVLGTGQVLIPVGTKAWSVTVVSGAAWVKGAGPLLPGTSVGGGGFDGRGTTSSTIAVGATGAAASTPYVLVAYDV